MSKKRTKSSWEYQERLGYIREFKISHIRKKKNFTGHDKSWITKEFRKLRNIDTDQHVFIPQSKTKLKQYKARGHYTTTKGIFLPRIKTDKAVQRITELSPQFITYRVKSRIDIQYNFTKREKLALLRGADIKPLISTLEKKAGIKYDTKIYYVFTGNNGSIEYSTPELAENYLNAMSDSGKKWLTGIRIIGFKRPSKKGKRR